MLESFVVNICVPGNDRYPEIVINQYPVIVLGRESDLHNALRSDEVKGFIKQRIKSYSDYKAAKFYIRHLRRDNTDQRGMIAVSDMVDIPESEWELNTPS